VGGPWPGLGLVPVAAALPVGVSWLKLQARLRRDSRLESLQGHS